MKLRPAIELILPLDWSVSLQAILEQSHIHVQSEYFRESMHNGPEFKITIPPGIEDLNHVITLIYFAGIKYGMK